jgi:hypothetical protein
MLRWAPEGSVYAPFCGELDIALGGEPEVYSMPGLYGGRSIYAADLDEERVRIAQGKLTTGMARVANCDEWPFADTNTGPIAIADFDAWAWPYSSFRAFWAHAEKADRVVMFFTDGQRMRVMGDGILHHPDGSERKIATIPQRQEIFYHYLSRYIWPWFDQYVEPWRVIERIRYLRGVVAYWGVAVERRRSPGARNGKGTRKALELR